MKTKLLLAISAFFLSSFISGLAQQKTNFQNFGEILGTFRKVHDSLKANDGWFTLENKSSTFLFMTTGSDRYYAYELKKDKTDPTKKVLQADISLILIDSSSAILRIDAWKGTKVKMYVTDLVVCGEISTDTGTRKLSDNEVNAYLQNYMEKWQRYLSL